MCADHGVCLCGLRSENTPSYTLSLVFCDSDFVAEQFKHFSVAGVWATCQCGEKMTASSENGRGGTYIDMLHRNCLLTAVAKSLINPVLTDTHCDCTFCVLAQRNCFSVAGGQEQRLVWFRTFPGALERNEDTEQFVHCVRVCVCRLLSLHWCAYSDFGK